MSQSITVEFDVPAAMRDGAILRANVFRPAAAGTYPVALTRTPYGKDFATSTTTLDAARLAREGYIVVIQDVRGRFASAGEWAPFHAEGNDGYDTVEWAAALPGSNGNVGMFGGSYTGFTQWAAAVQAPPHLKALVPAVTWADACDGVLWRGGAYELGVTLYWFLNMAFEPLLKRYAAAPPQQQLALGALVHEIDQLHTEGYYCLPLQELAPLKKLGLLSEISDYLAHPNDREYYAPISPCASLEQIQIPALLIGGWYDAFLGGTLHNFRALREQGATPAARQSKLLVGPWSHIHFSNVVGEMDFGFVSQATFINLQFDLTALTQRWFDYWLKGIDNGITREPPVKIFVMGDNAWRDETEFPLARAQATPFYLHSRGAAHTLPGAGALTPEPPRDEPPDRYTYDPAQPTPTHGGAFLNGASFNIGVRDQRALESRDDVLVYTTAPLTRAVQVTGPIVVKLWACSDARDTDFVARLVDVHPDGFAQNLTDGILRARYRCGDAPELLAPNQPYEFTLDLWATANVFQAGHRIRLDITSSNFPRWDRNPNTGAPFGADAALQPAQQTILHDAAHPSHVLLPLIPR